VAKNALIFIVYIVTSNAIFMIRYDGMPVKVVEHNIMAIEAILLQFHIVSLMTEKNFISYTCQADKM